MTQTSISSWVCTLSLLAVTGCGSSLKMQWGEPLEVDRGYAVDYTRFNQRGRQVDREHVKAELEDYEESAPAMTRATRFETASRIVGLVGIVGACLGGTLVRAEDDAAVPLVVAGGGLFGLAVGLSFAAESNYVEAVERYNQRVGAPESDLNQAGR